MSRYPSRGPRPIKPSRSGQMPPASLLPKPPPPQPVPEQVPVDPNAPAGSTPAQGTGPGGRPVFDKRVVRPTLHPRRVVGGVRMQSSPPNAIAGETIPEAMIPQPSASQNAANWMWASARWMRPVEDRALGSQLAEGLDYARAGQTRSLEFKPGMISAKVQGRMPQPYKTIVRLPTFTPEQWELAVGAMAGQAKYAASMLANELPANIEDLFAPLNLTLFPVDASDFSTSCECDVFTGRVRDYSQYAGGAGGEVPAEIPMAKPEKMPGTPLCKHVCCLMYLVADRLASQQLLIISLRGLPEQDLLERLRQARALQGLQRSTLGAAPIYTPHVPGVPTAPEPLEDMVQHFWTSTEPDALDTLDMPIAKPEVSHPLLRRIGPSPFTGAKFPITGLLATCYDVISEAIIRESESLGQEKEPEVLETDDE